MFNTFQSKIICCTVSFKTFAALSLQPILTFIFKPWFIVPQESGKEGDRCEERESCMM